MTVEKLVRHDLTQAQHDGAWAVIGMLLAVAVGFVLHRVLFSILIRLAKKHELYGAIVQRARHPSRFTLPLLAVLAIFPNLHLPRAWTALIEHLGEIATIASAAWIIVALLMLGVDYVKAYHNHDANDSLRYRQIETRVDILSRVAVTVVIVVAAATSLMTFPAVRNVGATLLASAGVAGLAVGFAMRPLFENLVAGIQIALTQPIRINDVVIVETEFGRVEEITATYVVVAIWDRRRMILPLTYFIDKPFQNWTRYSADLVGVVMLYTDYTMPIDALRGELDVVLPQTPLWDEDVKVIQITDTDVHGVQVRILVSARNAADLFDLRCFVREKLIAFIQLRYPQALPATRIDARTAVMPKDGHTMPELTRRV